ncbi:DUF2326 domain-containing protein [Nitratireductor aquimarinus]|uniref:DUF2326 domain-containing protein n=1 Tax=Nitratireductor aquimarinus TaxID=889300 RepID=A0ABU4AGC8_9HYPH|nr:DUF2326 domain-containing protein [Nitratireductor aquimarinus]MDV6225287.1 DUF2326 domain-containing protein [Nitratireductor aquimarinus]
MYLQVNMLQIRKLYSDPAVFDAIPFLPGVNLILGEPSEGSAKTNGVGKSIAIEFLNFALLSKYSSSRVKKIPKEVVPLDVEICVDLLIGSQEVTIKRVRGEENRPTILVNGNLFEFAKLEDAHSFLGNLLFEGSEATHPSFRSMLGILLRDERSEFKSIVNGYDTTLKISDDYAPHLYLLGVDISRYKKIKILQKEASDLRQKVKEYEKSVMLLRQKKIDDARADLNELDAEVSIIEQDIENLENTKSYDALEAEMQELDEAILERRRQSAIILDKISRLEPIEVERVEISTEELSEYYNDLKAGLGDLVAKDFDELQAFKAKIYRFQDGVLRKRRESLERSLKEVKDALRVMDKEYQKKLRLLDQGGALKALKQTFATYQEKADQLADLRSFISGHDGAVSQRREKLLEKDTEVQRLQVSIDQANRIKSSFEGTILDIHNFVMGNRQAAFHIETVDKAQVVDITLRIDSDGSHSVEREKTFIYDFSLLTNESTGERHFGLLVHDNIFEVDSDTLKRSLDFIAQHAPALQGQYILTLNSDRASSDAPDAMKALAGCVRARFTKQSRFLKKKYQEE